MRAAVWYHTSGIDIPVNRMNDRCHLPRAVAHPSSWELLETHSMEGKLYDWSMRAMMKWLTKWGLLFTTDVNDSINILTASSILQKSNNIGIIGKMTRVWRWMNGGRCQEMRKLCHQTRRLFPSVERVVLFHRIGEVSQTMIYSLYNIWVTSKSHVSLKSYGG